MSLNDDSKESDGRISLFRRALGRVSHGLKKKGSVNNFQHQPTIKESEPSDDYEDISCPDIKWCRVDAKPNDAQVTIRIQHSTTEQDTDDDLIYADCGTLEEVQANGLNNSSQQCNSKEKVCSSSDSKDVTQAGKFTKGVMSLILGNHSTGLAGGVDHAGGSGLNPEAESGLREAKSMDIINQKEGNQVPENQLQLLTPHQIRVQKSLEKLSLPSWYKPSTNVSNKNANPASNARWRKSSVGERTPAWRRQSLSRPSTPGSTYSTPPHTSYSRWSATRLSSLGGKDSSRDPSPAHSNFSIKSWQSSSAGNTLTNAHHRQPYLGWRSQERISGSSNQPTSQYHNPAAHLPNYVTTPTQRLVSSLSANKPPIGSSGHSSSSSREKTTYRPNSAQQRQSRLQQHQLHMQMMTQNPNLVLHDSIKQVTEAIVDYCADTDKYPKSPVSLQHQRSNDKQQVREGVTNGVSRSPAAGREEEDEEATVGRLHIPEVPNCHQVVGNLENGGKIVSRRGGRSPARHVWMESSFVSVGKSENLPPQPSEVANHGLETTYTFNGDSGPR